MRMLAKNEINYVVGAELVNFNDLPVPQAVFWDQKDPNGNPIPTWTPDGTLVQDVTEGLSVIVYLAGYKHYQSICLLVGVIGSFLAKR